MFARLSTIPVLGCSDGVVVQESISFSFTPYIGQWLNLHPSHRHTHTHTHTHTLQALLWWFIKVWFISTGYTQLRRLVYFCVSPCRPTRASRWSAGLYYTLQFCFFFGLYIHIFYIYVLLYIACINVHNMYESTFVIP